MLYEDTKRKLLEMHLTTMAQAFEEQLRDPTYTSLQFEDRFGMLVDAEFAQRKTNRLKSLTKKADFPSKEACLEGIDYLPERKLDKAQILRLASCQYIQDTHNVIIQGATGSGKTYLATVLGLEAVKRFYRVKYIRLPDLLCEMKLAMASNSFRSMVDNYQKFQLLIIDEWLLFSLSVEDSRNLLEIVESRYHKSSTIFCSQFDVKGWYSNIGDPLAADAICDRIVHDSYTITLAGSESMRKLKGLNNYNNLK